MGERVGIPWLGHTCGVCPYCWMHRENLCDRPLFTGLHARRRLRDGDDRRCALRVSARRGRQRRGARPVALRRPDRLAFAGDRRRRQEAGALRLRRRGPHRGAGREVAGALGVCLHAAREMSPTQAFARSLGATWAGGSDEMPPEPLDAAIIFATVGDLVPLALKAVRKGGRVVCAGIHMSDIPSFPYRCYGRSAQLRVGRQSHAAGWHRFPASGAGDRHRHQDHDAIRSTKPTRPSPISAPAGSKAPQFSFREHQSISEPIMRNPVHGLPPGTIYACPMHPQIRQVGPGNCRSAG